MNLFWVIKALNLNESNQQVMLFDSYKNGPYYELIKKAFSKNHPILRYTYYKNKIVLFRHLIFHLESSAGLIFPRDAKPYPLRCSDSTFFREYRKHILNSFSLYHVNPPAIPTITLSLRHRSDKKNTGRIIQNEQDVINMVKSGTLVNVNVVDMDKLSIYEQLQVARNTSILVGVHGAGLMHIMYAAEEAILVEIHPSYRHDYHFRHAARMSGKIYMPFRSLNKETCTGSSDNLLINIEELRLVIDGAVRIARSFDTGSSECGLVCPTQILAFDQRLNRFFTSSEIIRSKAISRFPCGA